MSEATAGPVLIAKLGLVKRLRDGEAPLVDPNLNDEAADEIERLRGVLAVIADLNPANDSGEGDNEWGAADCFDKAKKLARDATVCAA